MKKVLLGIKESVIEPLGLIYLSEVARQEEYVPKIVTIKDNNFGEFDKEVESFKPDLIGFSVFTGSHLPILDYLKDFRKINNGLEVILGGSHATFFPEQLKDYADYVVVSEGFNPFRRILRGEAEKGIVYPKVKEEFPVPDRELFYEQNKRFKESKIKSIITSTGCPFKCSYCYNSVEVDSLKDVLDEKELDEFKVVAGNSKRLFLRNRRSVDNVVKEALNILETSPTELIYFQDDVFADNIEWLREFKLKYSKLNLPYHAHMRFENSNPNIDKNKERLNLLRESGCTGLTFGIETSDEIIREEVLNRRMSNKIIFNSMYYLNELGFKVRTFNMLGLPFGATSKPTKINLESDLDTLKFNIKLREKTGLPTMAWASILTPYLGTEMGDYCINHGFYSGTNDDLPESFFDRSRLNFVNNWVGEGLNPKSNEWMNKEEQILYHKRLKSLQELFTTFALIPKGDILVKDYLNKESSFDELSKSVKTHLYDEVLYKD